MSRTEDTNPSRTGLAAALSLLGLSLGVSSAEAHVDPAPPSQEGETSQQQKVESRQGKLVSSRQTKIQSEQQKLESQQLKIRSEQQKVERPQRD